MTLAQLLLFNTPTVVSNLNGKIKELRLARDWTQQELANRALIDRGYLANLEAGTVKKPSAETFLKLARAFNIRPEELYQAAGYIKEAKNAYQYKESPEQILERLRLAQPVAIPVYNEFPVHAGTPAEPIDYIYIERQKAAKKNIEAYIIHGSCLEPKVSEGDVIIVDRDASIEHGDIVACLSEDRIIVGRLKKVGDDYWVQNSEFGMRLEDCVVSAKVIQVNKHFA